MTETELNHSYWSSEEYGQPSREETNGENHNNKEIKKKENKQKGTLG